MATTAWTLGGYFSDGIFATSNKNCGRRWATPIEAIVADPQPQMSRGESAGNSASCR